MKNTLVNLCWYFFLHLTWFSICWISWLSNFSVKLVYKSVKFIVSFIQRLPDGKLTSENSVWFCRCVPLKGKRSGLNVWDPQVHDRARYVLVGCYGLWSAGRSISRVGKAQDRSFILCVLLETDHVLFIQQLTRDWPDNDLNRIDFHAWPWGMELWRTELWGVPVISQWLTDTRARYVKLEQIYAPPLMETHCTSLSNNPDISNTFVWTRGHHSELKQIEVEQNMKLSSIWLFPLTRGLPCYYEPSQNAAESWCHRSNSRTLIQWAQHTKQCCAYNASWKRRNCHWCLNYSSYSLGHCHPGIHV